MTRTIAQKLARANEVLKRSDKGSVWAEHWMDIISDIMKEAPHGGGFRRGTGFNVDGSTSNMLLFSTEYYGTQVSGSFDGWMSYAVRVYSDFEKGLVVIIDGRNECNIHQYIREVFGTWLSASWIK